MKNLFELTVSAILPHRCAYCGRVISRSETECDECAEILPRIEKEICHKCGREKDECSCRSNERYYTALTAPFYFENNVRKGLHAFKFRKGKSNAEAYAKEIVETVKRNFGSVKFDFVTCVPMTEKSVKERGYNQCAVLAEEISKLLDIPFDPDILVKKYETPKQHDLVYVLRRGNLAGVFDVKNPEKVKGKSILLCDDISTSGETLDECSKMLWLYEAESIYCATVALTKKKKHKE